MVWNLSLSKMILVLGKARSHRAPNLGCRETELPRSFHVFPKISAGDLMQEGAHCHDEAANQSPVAHSWGLWIIQMVSTEDYLSLTQNLVQICCSTCSVTLNVTATKNTCSLNGVYHPQLTSTVKLSLFTHVHSSPLSLAARLYQCHANHSLYINIGWTFSRPRIYNGTLLRHK